MELGEKRGFVTDLDVRSVDWKTWKLLAVLRWVGWKGDIFEVQPGELTDFATTPSWTWIILPKTGTWTKAATLHDKMCNLLREYWKLMKAYNQLISDGAHPSHVVKPEKPPISSVDADAIFRKNAREDGTDPVRAELLWFGVRCGSLWDAHRRDEWMSTFPRWFFDLIWILATVAGFMALISWIWPW